MNTGARLAVYGLGLVVAFGGAFAIAGAVVPDRVVAEWSKVGEMNGSEEMNGHGEGHNSGSTGMDTTASDTLKGLALSVNGFVLSPIEAPTSVGELGELSFQVQDSSGSPVTECHVSGHR